MNIEIQMITLGIAQTNCYIVGDKNTGQALVVDPVDEAETIQQTAEQAGWKIELILATHSHFDHVLASAPLKALTGAPFYIHEKSKNWTLDDQMMRIMGRSMGIQMAEVDRYLSDEPETIELGGIRLQTIFTPGHAPDHIAFYMADHGILFGGDCLFAGGIGRTDLPFGDYELLMHSITTKMLPLGDDVQLLSGHGPVTTLGHERQTNSFILSYLRD